MIEIKRLCNKCGKEVEFYNDFTMSHDYGYESKHDGGRLRLNLCGTCLDELTTYFIKNYKINPVEECDYSEHYT